MKKVVRLTENDLRKIVLRVIREQEEMDRREAEDVAMDVIQDEIEQQTEDLSSEEIRKAIRNLEMVQRKIERNPELGDKTLEDVVDEIKEGELSEEDDLRSRRSKMVRNLKVGAGLGASAAGLLGLVSQGMGYIDLGHTFIAVHDAVASLGEYAPNISLATLVSGIIYALKAVADDKELKESYYRNNRRNYRR